MPGLKLKEQMQAAQFLKENTRDWHQRTESVAYGIEIRSGTLSPDLYGDLIQKNHFIHQELTLKMREAADKYKADILLPFMPVRTLALQRDLALLKRCPVSYPFTSFSYTSAPHLLGGLYVLLGSALGGSMIYKALIQNTQMKVIPDFHFFGTSKQITVDHWRNFCGMLDKHLVDEEQLLSAQAAARSTFRFFYEVYSAEKPLAKNKTAPQQ